MLEKLEKVGSLDALVNEQHYSNSYEWIAMKFYGEVQGGIRKN